MPRASKLYPCMDRMMTIREIAEAYRLNVGSMRFRVYHRKETPAEAAIAMDANRDARVLKKLLMIVAEDMERRAEHDRETG